MKIFAFLAVAFLSGGYLTSGEIIASSTTASRMPQLSPIPPYPPDGIIPLALEHQYVFRDLSTGNIILSYPPEIADSSAADVLENGRIKQVISIKSQVDPFFEVAITKVNSGLLYSYTVRNTKTAKQAIARWRLEGPPASSMIGSSSVETLGAGQMKRTQAPTSWFAAEPSSGFAWVARGQSGVVLSGSSATGFSVRSELKPGFVRAFASGSIDSPLNVQSAPGPVRQQLTQLEPFFMDQQLALTIGPKFSLTAPDAAIVMDFAAGIQILIKHQYLSARSPLIQELSNKLHVYLQTSASVPEVGAEQYPHFTLHIQTKPKTDLEKVIVGALQANFEVN